MTWRNYFEMVNTWGNGSKMKRRGSYTSRRKWARRNFTWRLGWVRIRRLWRSWLPWRHTRLLMGGTWCLKHENTGWARVRRSRRWAIISPKQHGIFIDSRRHISKGSDSLIVHHRWDSGMRRGLRLRVIVIQLIDNDDLSIVGKEHLEKDNRYENG